MKTFNVVFLIICLIFCDLFAVSWGNLPPEIQKCKSKDNEACVIKTVEDILRRYPTGNPDFGMPNVSAFNVSNLRVSRSNPDSPVQINFVFTKSTTYGLESIKVLKASGFDKELNNIDMVMLVPTLKMKGDYEMMGKILLLPINGKGEGEVVLKESKMSVRVKMEKEVVRDKKTYFKLRKLKALVEPKQMFVQFENLLNGNPVLSKTINDVINENWQDVWTELQDGINHAMETIVQGMVKDIFSVLALEEMYTD